MPIELVPNEGDAGLEREHGERGVDRGRVAVTALGDLHHGVHETRQVFVVPGLILAIDVNAICTIRHSRTACVTHQEARRSMAKVSLLAWKGFTSAVVSTGTCGRSARRASLSSRVQVRQASQKLSSSRSSRFGLPLRSETQ